MNDQRRSACADRDREFWRGDFLDFALCHDVSDNFTAGRGSHFKSFQTLSHCADSVLKRTDQGLIVQGRTHYRSNDFVKIRKPFHGIRQSFLIDALFKRSNAIAKIGVLGCSKC